MQDRRPAAGFTVIEMVVALFVLALVLVGMLALFDASNKVARTQVNIADMQQSLRIGHDEMVRMARIAARGWVVNNTNWKPEDQIKLAVDNAGPAVYIGTTTDPEFKVQPGTDVLHIRGVINGSIFELEVDSQQQCDPGNQAGNTKGGCSVGSFLATALPLSGAGLKQDLKQLERAEQDGNSFSLVMLTEQGELAKANAEVDEIKKTGADITEATTTVLAGTSSEAWMSDKEGGHDIKLMGIVDEYAFYIRENDGRPCLSLARFKPGTNQPFGDDPANLRQDIADDIIDLQVALGIDEYADTNGDNFIDALDHGDGIIEADEWFHAGVAGVGAPPALGTKGDLQLVRINTLARTKGRDFQYVSKAIDHIENHIYPNETTTVDVAERNHRRRLLQTVLNLRNM